MSVDACFMIAGEAGQGLQSIGQILARTLARGGFHVFVDQTSSGCGPATRRFGL